MTNQTSPNGQNAEPLRVIRPVAIPAQFAIRGPLIAAFAAFFLGFFVFVFSNVLNGVLGDPFANGMRPIFGYGIATFFIAFFAGLALQWMLAFEQPKYTTYKLFADRVEYEEGLFTRHRRTLLFNQVLDVELTEGMLQQSKNAGTITLVTRQLVDKGDDKIGNLRISLVNIPDPKSVYDLIRSLALPSSTVET